MVRYYHSLKAMGLDARVYYYPEDGHGILSLEPGIDAIINMLAWWDEHHIAESVGESDEK